MAPRTAKTKKVEDVKVVENEAPKKGRGKAKAVEEPEQDGLDIDINDKPVEVAEKKAKRGKKAAEKNGDQNGVENAPPAKKGKKKNVDENDEDEKVMNGDNLSDDGKENGLNGENVEANGNNEVEKSSGKGRKKQPKKETEVKPKESGKGKKNAKVDNDEEKDSVELKPAAKGRGRKAQTKVENETESEDKTEAADEEVKPQPKGKKKAAAKAEKADSEEKSVEEDTKSEPASGKSRKKGPAKKKAEKQAQDSQDEEMKEDELKPEPTKGRKKPQTKAAVKEKVDSDNESEKDQDVEDLGAGEPKKQPKGRKNQGKKAPVKDELDEDSEASEEAPAKKRKVTKKEQSKEDDTNGEDAPVKAKGKRGQKKAEVAVEAEDDEESSENSNKRRRKAEEKVPADEKKKAPLKNKATTDYESIDFSNTSRTSQDKEWNFKISCWNVDGIRAWLTKGGLDYIQNEKPDILCLQEVKCSQDKLPNEVVNLPGYHAYWLCSDKDGYAGVGLYTTKLAISVQYGLQNEELDSEGRIITAEYEQFYLICTYVPNAGRKLVSLPKRLQWNEVFRNHVKELDKKKPVIICGDMNVAHNEIDLSNPKTNRKNAGFTDEERAGMSDLLGDGFVDTFRHYHPDKTGVYTFWTYMMNCRAKNVGWRLDYFIVSERFLPSVSDSVIRDKVYGSDHCPISLFLHLTSADKPKEQ